MTARMLIDSLVDVICSWCGAKIGQKEMGDKVDPALQGKPTHGICQACRDKMTAKIRLANSCLQNKSDV